MKLFKYLFFILITSILFTAIFMLTSLIFDKFINQIFIVVGDNAAFEFIVSAWSILEWILYIPLVVCLAHLTSKGVAFSNLSFGEAIKEALDKMINFLKAILPFPNNNRVKSIEK